MATQDESQAPDVTPEAGGTSPVPARAGGIATRIVAFLGVATAVGIVASRGWLGGAPEPARPAVAQTSDLGDARGNRGISGPLGSAVIEPRSTGSASEADEAARILSTDRDASILRGAVDAAKDLASQVTVLPASAEGSQELDLTGGTAPELDTDWSRAIEQVVANQFANLRAGLPQDTAQPAADPAPVIANTVTPPVVAVTPAAIDPFAGTVEPTEIVPPPAVPSVAVPPVAALPAVPALPRVVPIDPATLVVKSVTRLDVAASRSKARVAKVAAAAKVEPRAEVKAKATVAAKARVAVAAKDEAKAKPARRVVRERIAAIDREVDEAEAADEPEAAPVRAAVAARAAAATTARVVRRASVRSAVEVTEDGVVIREPIEAGGLSTDQVMPDLAGNPLISVQGYDRTVDRVTRTATAGLSSGVVAAPLPVTGASIPAVSGGAAAQVSATSALSAPGAVSAPTALSVPSAPIPVAPVTSIAPAVPAIGVQAPGGFSVSVPGLGLPR